MKKLYTLLLATALTFPTLAHAEAQLWEINKDDAASHINFEGTQMGAPFNGNFKQFSGTIEFDADNLAESKADITIPLSSVEANSTDRNTYLATEDWFDTTKFPDAKFVTKSITKTEAENTYLAKGELTIRGITVPVTLPFKLTTTGEQAVMEGQTTLKRLEFGIGAKWDDPSSVGLDVKLDIKITATKKAKA